MAPSPCVRSLLNLARRGVPHLLRHHPGGQHPGRLDADPDHYRPAQCLSPPGIRVLLGGRLMAGDLRPAESEGLAGNPRRGEGGRDHDYLAGAAVAAAALITFRHAGSFLLPNATRPSVTPPVDHPMAVPPARAAGRAEMIAAASSAGWRVATSQCGGPAAGPVTSTCGRHRRHLSRRRGTPPAVGSVTSMYTASRRYGLISVNAAGSARGPAMARVCARSRALTSPTAASGSRAPPTISSPFVTSIRGRPHESSSAAHPATSTA